MNHIYRYRDMDYMYIYICFFNHVHPFLDDGELIDKSQSIQRHYEMLEYLVDGSTVNISCHWTSKKTQSFLIAVH